MQTAGGSACRRSSCSPRRRAACATDRTPLLSCGPPRGRTSSPHQLPDPPPRSWQVRSLLFAVSALLSTEPPRVPTPPTGSAPEGAASSAAHAPGMGFRLAKLHRAMEAELASEARKHHAAYHLSADHGSERYQGPRGGVVSAAAAGMTVLRHWADFGARAHAWRAALRLPPPPELPPVAPAARDNVPGWARKSVSSAPPELTPELTPSSAAASLLFAAAVPS